MYALDGQKSFNMFEHDFTNHVPNVGPNVGTALNLLIKTFAKTSSWPTMVGLKDTASIDQHGVSVEKTKYGEIAMDTSSIVDPEGAIEKDEFRTFVWY